MNQKAAIWTTAALILVGAGGCVDRAAQAQNKKTAATLQNPVMPVVVKPVVTATLFNTLEITGQVTTSDDVAVGAKVPGKIVSVTVKEGDKVRAGDVIATQDTVQFRLQARQAMAQVQAARSAVNQAISNARIAPSRSASAVAAAQAQLRAARAQQQKALKGARTEERAQAANNVEAARSNMETARKDLDRKRKLYEDGAISRQMLDMAENAYQAALSQYENALQALKITENASRPEDLEAAKEAVRQAEEGVRSAKAAQRLDVLLNDQVQAAQANLQAAQSQLEMARQNISDAVIRSPFAGSIAGKPVQVGAVVGAGTPIAHVVGVEGVYFEGQVNENAIDKVRPGKQVQVDIDAIGGRPISGSVVAVNPLGNEVGRLFSVRVRLDGDLSDVKPGMFARGKVVLETLRDVPVIQSTAVVQRSDGSYVFVVRDDKAAARKITTGLRTDGLIQVSGLPLGEKVVVQGQNTLDEGTKVEIKKPSTQDGAVSGDQP